MLTIKVKYMDGVDEIVQAHPGEWYDLRAAEKTFIPLNGFKKIPLGVAMELPEGYEAIVVPRSSLFDTFGVILVNGIGVIDHAYCGDNDWWSFPAYCLRAFEMTMGQYGSMIPKNFRIAQFRLFKQQEAAELIKVDSLGNKDRGGFGSSGGI